MAPCRHCSTQCPQPCSRPPAKHASTGDSWTLQEGLCHTQVCCTQSLCPFSSPLLTRTSSADSLCGVSGSWCTALFEPSERLWRVWGLILKCDFVPPTVLLGLLLCPWMRGISSKSLQCCADAAPVPCSHAAPPPINRKLESRFTEHGLVHQNKTQFPPQSVSSFTKLP